MLATVSREGFHTLALSHLRGLHAVARRLTGSSADAEDLVQETLLRAWQAWDSFGQSAHCKAWLLRILRNTFINGYRRKKTERTILLERADGTLADPEALRVVAEHWCDPEQCYHQAHVSPKVVRAIGELPQRHREVLVLTDLEERSYQQVADCLGVPIGTVMSRLHRARRSLRSVLVEEARAHGIRTDARAA
jgi:RNA polymerase sigma-70 factor (ECF subfamily)